jgi:hypothetical protein
MKLFQHIPTQFLNDVDVQVPSSQEFLQYKPKVAALSLVGQPKASLDSEICAKISRPKANCLKFASSASDATPTTESDQCELCTAGIRLKDSKCLKETQDDFSTTCEVGCSHCSWAKVDSSSFLQKTCLVCGPGYFRSSNTEDGNCYSKKDLKSTDDQQKIKLLGEIRNCDNHDYRDPAEPRCYLCKKGWVLRAGNKSYCEKVPVGLMSWFKDCRILENSSDTAIESLRCKECVRDELLRRDVNFLLS